MDGSPLCLCNCIVVLIIEMKDSVKEKVRILHEFIYLQMMSYKKLSVEIVTG